MSDGGQKRRIDTSLYFTYSCAKCGVLNGEPALIEQHGTQQRQYTECGACSYKNTVVISYDSSLVAQEKGETPV